MKIAREQRKLVVLGLLASIALFTGGCIEEKDSVTVYPNGSGTLRVKQTLGKQMSQMILFFGGKDEDSRKEAATKSLYDECAKWDGVTAWTDLKGEVKNDQVSTEGLGYFEDVSKLKKVTDSSTETFAWTKNADGSFTLEWSSKNEGKKTQEKDPLEEKTPKAEEMNMVLGMLKDLRMEHQVTMPGEVTAADGCKEKKDRSASGVVVGDDLAPILKDMVAKIEDYKKKVKAGEMTKEKASAELKEKYKSIGLDNLKVTSKAGDTQAEFAEFTKAFEAAKKAYAGSEAETKVKEAKKPKAAFGAPPKGGDEDEGGMGGKKPGKKDKKNDDDE